MVLVFALLAGFRVVSAARELREAKTLLDRAGSAIENGQITDGRAALVQATSRLSKAQSALGKGRLELDLLRATPVLGDNLVGLRRSVAVAQELSNGGVRILDAAEPLVRADGSLEVPMANGTVPLPAIRAVLSEIELLRTSLPSYDDIDDDPGLLLGPVQDIHDKVNEELVRRKGQLGVLGDALTLLVDLSGGNGYRATLIAVANTAEMRGSGGMILNFGGLIGVDGTFGLTRFARIDEAFLTEAVPRSEVASVPDDYLTRWDGFEPLRLWRNATLSADFTVTGPVLEAMASTATSSPIGAVIQIDPQGLASLLRAVGPVNVAEIGEINADNLVSTVLYDAYEKYPGIEDRSDVLEQVARAAFTRLVEGNFPSLRPVGTAIAEALQSRHLIVHTKAAGTQARLESLGAAGQLPALRGPDAFSLTVQNVSANKLDYFLDTAVELSGDRSPGVINTLTAKVVIRNSATPGATSPKYVYGPFDAAQEPGLYRGVVSFYVPEGTNLVGVSGDPTRYPAIADTEDGRPVVSYTIDLPAGERHELDIELELAPRKAKPYEVVLVPQPRVRPTVWRLALVTGDGRLTGTTELERATVVPVGAKPRAWRPEDTE